MSETLYIQVTDEAPGCWRCDPCPGVWRRADVVLNGEVVATGFARVSTQDKTDAQTAVTLAQGKFMRNLLASDIRYPVRGSNEVQVPRTNGVVPS